VRLPWIRRTRWLKLYDAIQRAVASRGRGWKVTHTGLAKIIQLYGILDAKKVLEGVKRAAFKKGNA